MSQLSRFRRQLRRLGRRRALVRRGTAFSLLGLTLLGLGWSWFLVDWLFTLDTIQRAVVGALALFGLSWVLWRSVIPRWRIREQELDVALLVERRVGMTSDLTAALQFDSPLAANWGSPQLRTALIERVVETTRHLNPLAGETWGTLPRDVALFLLFTTATAVALNAFPAYGRAFLNRLLLGPAQYPTQTQFAQVLVNRQTVWARELASPYEGLPAPHEAALTRGLPVELFVQATGRLPSTGQVRLQSGRNARPAAFELERLSIETRRLRLEQCLALLTPSTADTKPAPADGSPAEQQSTTERSPEEASDRETPNLPANADGATGKESETRESEKRESDNQEATAKQPAGTNSIGQEATAVQPAAAPARVDQPRAENPTQANLLTAENSAEPAASGVESNDPSVTATGSATGGGSGSDALASSDSLGDRDSLSSPVLGIDATLQNAMLPANASAAQSTEAVWREAAQLAQLDAPEVAQLLGELILSPLSSSPRVAEPRPSASLDGGSAVAGSETLPKGEISPEKDTELAANDMAAKSANSPSATSDAVTALSATSPAATSPAATSPAAALESAAGVGSSASESAAERSAPSDSGESAGASMAAGDAGRGPIGTFELARKRLLRTLQGWPASASPGVWYRAELGPLLEDSRYELELADARTDEAHIKILQPPLLDLDFEVVPPSYALASEPISHPLTRQFAVLEGSNIQFRAKSATGEPLQRVWIDINQQGTQRRYELSPRENEAVDVGPDRTSADGQLPGRGDPIKQPQGSEASVVKRGATLWELRDPTSPLQNFRTEFRFVVQAVDPAGATLELPLEGQIRPRADRPPQAAIELIHRVVLPTATPSITYRVQDDFGIAKAMLHVEIERQTPLVSTPDANATSPTNPDRPTTTDAASAGSASADAAAPGPTSAKPASAKPQAIPDRESLQASPTPTNSNSSNADSSNADSSASGSTPAADSGSIQATTSESASSASSLGEASANETPAVPLERHAIDLPLPSRPLMGDQLPHQARYPLSLLAWKLQPGDRLKLTLEVADERGAAPSRTYRSEPVVLEVTDEAGLLAAIAEADEESEKKLDEVIQQQLGIGDKP